MNAQPEPTGEEPLCVIGETRVGDVNIEDVGAKAYNLMRMTEAGLPVPPAFVLGTRVCRDYHGGGAQLGRHVAGLAHRGVRRIERATGLQFGARRRPLLVAVRSGAAASMPGMMETILNIGLSDATLPGLLRATGDPVFVWDSYRRLIQSYGEVVEGCPAAPFAAVLSDATTRSGVPTVAELDVAALQSVVRNLQGVYQSIVGHPFPQDPMAQLLGAIEAVLRSWNGDRAVEYRTLEGLTHLTGTAVTVQAMVFGNMGVTSGSGVGFTRDPATGEDHLYVDFLLNAQGEDVVAGRQAAGDPEPLIAAVPGLAHELQTVRRRLETLFGDAQDFEFTVEDGRLWLLQTRTAKRTPWAALHIACDLVDEELIDPATAVQRLRDVDLDSITRVRLAGGATAQPIAHGMPAGTGIVTGHAVSSIDAVRRYAEDQQTVVLIRDEASTEDISALALCQGLVTATGARTSHAAVVARQLGVVCVVGCQDLTVDMDQGRVTIAAHQLDEGDVITVDGTTGLVYRGEMEVRLERPQELIDRVRCWEDAQTHHALDGRPSPSARPTMGRKPLSGTTRRGETGG